MKKYGKFENFSSENSVTSYEGLRRRSQWNRGECDRWQRKMHTSADGDVCIFQIEMELQL